MFHCDVRTESFRRFATETTRLLLSPSHSRNRHIKIISQKEDLSNTIYSPCVESRLRTCKIRKSRYKLS
eukprot:UN06299